MKIRYLIASLFLFLTALGQQGPTTVNLLSDLLAIHPNPNKPLVLVLGDSAVNDGGGGEFVWNATSTDATNVASPYAWPWGSASGRWIRRIESYPIFNSPSLEGTTTVPSGGIFYAENGTLFTIPSVHLSGDPDEVGDNLAAQKGWVQGLVDAISGGTNYNTTYTVSNTNILRNLTSGTLTNYSQIQMGGYYTNGDGGGGTLYVDLDDTTSSDDGGSVFVVDGIRVKALLRQGDYVSIRRFGATPGDGVTEPSTGCATQIQAALDWGNSILGATIVIPEGEWYIQNTLHLHPRVNMFGVGGVKFFDGTYPLTSSSLQYRKGGNSTIVLKSGANVPMVDLDPTGGYERVTGKTQYGIELNGIIFHGNWGTQTKYDCHALKFLNAWGIVVRNCGFARVQGYDGFIYDCNTVNFFDCVSIGQTTTGKSWFFYSCADNRVINNEFGAGAGPVVWITGGVGSWVSHYHDNLLYNAQRQRFTATGVSANTITVSPNHTYETGMPVEVLADGGTIPTGTAESICYFAIKVSSSQIKLATTYSNALAGTAMTISGGSGTWYVFHGYASGLYVSDNAVGLTLNNNRTEQHYDSGITLAKVIGATVVGGISAQNGWDTQGQVMTGESMAGVELRNATRDVLITGNSFFGSIDKVQAYGVHMDSDAGVNTVGFNSMPQYIGTNIFNEATATNLVTQVFASGAKVQIESTGAGTGLRVSDSGTIMSRVSSGTTTLVGGTATVGLSTVTANTKIYLTVKTPGGTPGFLDAGTRTPSSGFTVTSSSGTDTSSVEWLAIEP